MNNTVTLTDPERRTGPEPDADNRTPHSPRNRVGLIALAILAVALVVVALLLAIGALGFGDSNDEASAPAATSSTTTTTAAAAGFDDPDALLLDFGEAWRTADWTRMQAYASADVVATAGTWYEDGGYPNITSDNIETVMDNCWAESDGATTCQFLYAPAEGMGLIFNATYAGTDNGLEITRLVFGGDAG